MPPSGPRARPESAHAWRDGRPGTCPTRRAGASSSPAPTAASTAGVPPASYVGPGGPGELRGHPAFVHASAAARDQGAAARLWDLSERLTEIRFDFAAATR